MELLPEDCITHVLSFMSPRDACQSSAVCLAVKDAVESEVLWDKFLPPDHQEIVSRMVSPVTFASKKELFFKLSTPLLIDGGLKTFSIDKATGKKCYVLSARELYIPWSAVPLFWYWKPMHQSRFPEAVELLTVSWLEIQGRINTQTLSPNTHYGAYLIVQVSHNRVYGLDTLPTEVSVEVGHELHSRRMINLSTKISDTDKVVVMEGLRTRSVVGSTEAFHERKDGWLEIELGEFYNDGMTEKEVKMSLREVNGVHLKGGLVVEGIEVRPI